MPGTGWPTFAGQQQIPMLKFSLEGLTGELCGSSEREQLVGRPDVEEQLANLTKELAALKAANGVGNTVTAEVFYYLTIPIMILIHVGFLGYEMGASRTKNVLASSIKNILAFAFLVPTFYYFGWFVYWAFPTGFTMSVGPQEISGLEYAIGAANPHEGQTLKDDCHEQAELRHASTKALAATTSTHTATTSFHGHEDKGQGSKQGRDDTSQTCPVFRTIQSIAFVNDFTRVRLLIIMAKQTRRLNGASQFSWVAYVHKLARRRRQTAEHNGHCQEQVVEPTAQVGTGTTTASHVGMMV